MNLNQLRAFCTLSRTLHYSRASEELQIAQPSLSRMIAQLEKELGTPLFEKQGRNIILTKQGEIFLDHVSRGVGEIDQGVSVLKEFIDPGQGTIDFAFIYALSPSFVPHLVKKFLDAPENKNIHFHFYHTVTLKEAACYDFILPLDKTSFVEQQLKKASITPSVSSRVEEDHAAAALVSINLGIAIIPKNKMLEHYDVKLIPFGPEPLYRVFYMATSKGHSFTPAAGKFYRFLLEETKR